MLYFVFSFFSTILLNLSKNSFRSGLNFKNLLFIFQAYRLHVQNQTNKLTLLKKVYALQYCLKSRFFVVTFVYFLIFASHQRCRFPNRLALADDTKVTESKQLRAVF